MHSIADGARHALFTSDAVFEAPTSHVMAGNKFLSPAHCEGIDVLAMCQGGSLLDAYECMKNTITQSYPHSRQAAASQHQGGVTAGDQYIAAQRSTGETIRFVEVAIIIFLAEPAQG